MKLNRQQIQDRAMEVLELHPQGIRWTDLLRTVASGTPETPHNSVHGAIHALLSRSSEEIPKVARGFYKLAKYVEVDLQATNCEDNPEAIAPPPTLAISAEPLVEQDFYDSFAEWLEDNDEATVASALGGASLGGKWGTPDVIGVLKPRAQDIFKFEPQIITAEIKAVPNQPVVAFGQAVAYRLFSHKSYIVVPNTTNGDDMSRLKSLCSIHGVGLVTFTLDKNNPDYSVIILPVNASPDVFYVNNVLDRLKATEPRLLNKLF